MRDRCPTVNSAAGVNARIHMQGQLLSDDDCACFLVEAIAKRSQNIPWVVSVDGTRQKHRRIRRVSMDEFYKTVTGQSDAFYQMCMALPAVIEEVVAGAGQPLSPRDTVLRELERIAGQKNGSFALALYMLGFESYIGF